MDYRKKNRYGYIKRTQNHYKNKISNGENSENTDKDVKKVEAMEESRKAKVRALLESDISNNLNRLDEGIVDDIKFKLAKFKSAAGNLILFYKFLKKMRLKNILKVGLVKAFNEFIKKYYILHLEKGDINNKLNNKIFTVSVLKTALFKGRTDDLADVIRRLKTKEFKDLEKDEQDFIYFSVYCCLIGKALMNFQIETQEHSGDHYVCPSMLKSFFINTETLLTKLKISSFSSFIGGNEINMSKIKVTANNKFVKLANKISLQIDISDTESSEDASKDDFGSKFDKYLEDEFGAETE